MRNYLGKLLRYHANFNGKNKIKFKLIRINLAQPILIHILIFLKENTNSYLIASR